MQARRLWAVARRDARASASSPWTLALNLLYGFLVAWGMVLAFGGGPTSSGGRTKRRRCCGVSMPF